MVGDIMTETDVPSYGKDTYIIDIDGCIIETVGKLSGQLLNEPKLLPGVLELFDYLSGVGSRIVLLTGRPESSRKETEDQLKRFGIWWDELVMISSNGRRILINDTKPNSDAPTAIGLTVTRNEGLSKILERLTFIDNVFEAIDGDKT